MKFDKPAKKIDRKNEAKPHNNLIQTKKKNDKHVSQSKKPKSADTTKPSSSNDIDGIFASVIKPKMDESKNETKQPRNKVKPTIQSETTLDSTSSYGLMKSLNVTIISPEAPLERIDKESGLPVYKAHLLKVGEGGGTELCPFDCDCCF